jgi:hypothetical protein
MIGRDRCCVRVAVARRRAPVRARCPQPAHVACSVSLQRGPGVTVGRSRLRAAQNLGVVRVGEPGGVAGAESPVRAGQAAVWYSWRSPPSRSCRRTLRCINVAGPVPRGSVSAHPGDQLAATRTDEVFGTRRVSPPSARETPPDDARLVTAASRTRQAALAATTDESAPR